MPARMIFNTNLSMLDLDDELSQFSFCDLERIENEKKVN